MNTLSMNQSRGNPKKSEGAGKAGWERCRTEKKGRSEIAKKLRGRR